MPSLIVVAMVLASNSHRPPSILPSCRRLPPVAVGTTRYTSPCELRVRAPPRTVARIREARHQEGDIKKVTRVAKDQGAKVTPSHKNARGCQSCVRVSEGLVQGQCMRLHRRASEPAQVEIERCRQVISQGAALHEGLAAPTVDPDAQAVVHHDYHRRVAAKNE